MGEVGKRMGGLLSLGTEKQRVNVSTCVCASACAYMFADGKGNSGEKGSQETAILQKKR